VSTGQITELLRYAEAEIVPLVCDCPRAAVVRFFARCTEDEAWRLANAWLDREMGKRL